jgi:hypothetical protein
LLLVPRPKPKRSKSRPSPSDPVPLTAIATALGGLSTKIHTAVRGLGCPVRFVLTAGQKGDAPQADALIEDLAAEVVGLRQRPLPQVRQRRRRGRVAIRFEKTTQTIAPSSLRLQSF